MNSTESGRASREARRGLLSRAGREGDDKHSNALVRYLQALYARERRPREPKAEDRPRPDDEEQTED